MDHKVINEVDKSRLFNESPSNGIIPSSYALDNEAERPKLKGALAQ